MITAQAGSAGKEPRWVVTSRAQVGLGAVAGRHVQTKQCLPWAEGLLEATWAHGDSQAGTR